MNDFRLLISSLVTSSYKNDELLQCISGIFSENRENAVNSYTRLCELLLENGKTLSDYISALTVKDTTFLFKEFIRTHSELLRYNIRHDFSILSEISHIKSYEFIGDLRTRFNIPENFVFPMYENGNADIDFEQAEKYIETYGSSFYANNTAFIYKNGELETVEHFDKIKLSELKSYEAQRKAVIENTLRFINGQRYNNVLLYGDCGTGKSSTVKAIANEYACEGLRLIELKKKQLHEIPNIVEAISKNPLKFIIFIDDLSFEASELQYKKFKSVLEGGIEVQPANVLVYVTSNRRNLVKEMWSDRGDSGEVHARDGMEERQSLADRFGLTITFSAPDKKLYEEIVRSVAKKEGVDMDEETLLKEAVKWDARQTGRSGRSARQFVTHIAGKKS